MDEMLDRDDEYNMSKPRRRSNSTSNGSTDFMSKFEQVEVEPVFIEALHGPTPADYENVARMARMEKQNSVSSGSMGSVDEEDVENVPSH